MNKIVPRARGGSELDLEWQSGKLTHATLRGVANTTGNVTVRHENATVTIALPLGASRVLRTKDWDKP